MTPLLFVLTTFVIALLAGGLGALLGLGGGIIVVPALTLLMRVDIRLAIGASIVAVIATSSGAAAAYVRERLTNLRVAMFLELGTTSGAITGAFIAGRIHPRFLFVLFGLVLAWSAIAMLRKRVVLTAEATAPLSRALRLGSSYYDEILDREINYKVARPVTGLGLMYGAGIVSGLLGVGSGALKVPSMDLAMRLPIKVSTATSNFMIGVTAAASAGVYFSRGQIDPFIAAPVAMGVLIGALFGSRMLPRIENRVVRQLFVAALLIISIQMLIKGVAGS